MLVSKITFAFDTICSGYGTLVQTALRGCFFFEFIHDLEQKNFLKRLKDVWNCRIRW